MQLPLQITFRNMERSPAVEAEIQRHAAKLERFSDRITRCSIAVEKLHRHHRQGNHYHVRIDLTVPGGELVASRQPDEHGAYTDVYVAIRDAFLSLRRQLEEDTGRKEQRRAAGEPSTEGEPG